MRAARAALAVVALAACKSAPATSAGDAAPSAPAAPRDAAPAAVSPPTRREPDRCRAIGVNGKITVGSGLDGGAGDRALHLTDEIEPHTWVLLDRDAHLTSKDTRTARELAFDGPGRVQPCGTLDARADDEETWVAEGAFASTPGAGEVPGQEQWVVTPLAVVRYSAAAVKVAVSRGNDGAARVTVRLGGGAAYLQTNDAETAQRPRGAPDAGGGAWTRLDVGQTVDLAQKPGRRARDEAGAGWTACARLRAFDVDGEGPPLSPEQRVVRRQGMRAACAIGALRATEHLGPTSAAAAWESGLATARRDSGAPMALPLSQELR